jgi:hypothetical protein
MSAARSRRAGHVGSLPRMYWTATNLAETPTRTVALGPGATVTVYLAYVGCM